MNNEELVNILRGDRVKPKKLEKTDPGSFRAWRRFLEFAKEENQWTNRRAISKAYASIEGKAETLASRCPPNLPPPEAGDEALTLKEYLDKLQAVFIPDSNRRLANQGFRAARQKKGEMPDAWGTRIFNLHCDAYPDMEPDEREECQTLIDAFIDGMRDRGMNMTLQRSDPDTLQEAINLALQERNTIFSSAKSQGENRKAVLKARPFLGQAESHGSDDEDDKERSSNGLHEISLQALSALNFRGRGRGRSSWSNRPFNRQTSFNWRGNNFKPNQSPSRGSPQGFRGGRNAGQTRGQQGGARKKLFSPGCWNCGQMGHMKRACPNPPNPASINQMQELLQHRMQALEEEAESLMQLNPEEDNSETLQEMSDRLQDTWEEYQEEPEGNETGN